MHSCCRLRCRLPARSLAPAGDARRRAGDFAESYGAARPANNFFSSSSKSLLRAFSRLAGAPTYTPHASSDLATTDKAPTEEPSPISTPGRMTLPEPTITWRPSRTGAVFILRYSCGTVGLVSDCPE